MSIAKAYAQRAFKRSFTTLILVGLGIVFLWLNVISGSNGVVVSDTMKLFTCNEQLGMIIESIRLPRALGALLVGMLLGLSGVAMQVSAQSLGLSFYPWYLPSGWVWRVASDYYDRT